ncbi:hypothetical protein [Pseudomonas sp.]|uniref:hypothetical protein n=1 Tax=Pseudomonas sp. TaxID=306 RepID=UPI00258C5B69|nr:hypothetical protein [Pseudomonas sp.]
MLKKVIFAALVYLLIGGTINGFALATSAEKCGEKVNDIDGYAEAALLWPSLMASAFVLAVMGTELESTCKTTK